MTVGLFRDLGRRAEELKREATEAAGETADYECADCGTPLFTERSTCPDCGSSSVVAKSSVPGDGRSESGGNESTGSAEETAETSEKSDDA